MADIWCPSWWPILNQLATSSDSRRLCSFRMKRKRGYNNLGTVKKILKLIKRKLPHQVMHLRRVQLLTIDSWRNKEEVITPFCPPDVKERRSKARKSLGSKIDGGRIKNPIQKMLIMSTTRNNLPCRNQITKIKTNRQLAEPQLVSTHRRIIKFVSGRLIFSKDTRREEPWLNDFHKGDSVFIIFVDIIKVECGLKIGIIISICKLDDGF
jgi:hypothetical protein